PRSMRRVVVLPAPLGPRKPTTVPWSTSKLRSSTATTSPKRLVSPSMVMTAMASSLPPAGLLVEADHVKGAEHSSTVRSGGGWGRGPLADISLWGARRGPAHGVGRAPAASRTATAEDPRARWRTGEPPRPTPWPGGGSLPGPGCGRSGPAGPPGGRRPISDQHRTGPVDGHGRSAWVFRPVDSDDARSTRSVRDGNGRRRLL